MRGFIVTTVAAFLAVDAVTALWPAPKTYSGSTGIMRLSSSFSINAPSGVTVPSDLQTAMTNASYYIKNDNLQALQLNLSAIEAMVANTSNVLTALNMRMSSSNGTNSSMQSITDAINMGPSNRNESYSLAFGNGTATLTAGGSLGFLRGLQTFTELVYTTSTNGSSTNGTQYILNAPTTITDSAAYPVRGLLLDTSRNYYPVTSVKAVLLAMSWSKMNHFHWHITDSQSWPLEVSAYPTLSQLGAYSPQQVYTRANVLDVISYANSLGIEVMLEIDSPGHTNGIAPAYPDLVACSDFNWTIYALEPPAGQIRITTPAAMSLMNGIVNSTTAGLPGSLFSTGGDEINLVCYQNDTQVQQSLNSTGLTLNQALERFSNGTRGAAIANGKTVVVWEDQVVGEQAVYVEPSTIVIAWRGSDSLLNISQTGHRIIQASTQPFYLDCGLGGWVGPYPNYCSFNSWWDMYNFNTTANITTPANLLGGMAAMWAEQAGPTVVEAQVWPRAAALSELWWLGASGANGQGLMQFEALPRLIDFTYRMIARGVGARPLQPEWCALRPGQCILPPA